ncbi:MAG: hypothetical protein AAGG68_28745 [Bacteroidota bacterium]
MARKKFPIKVDLRILESMNDVIFSLIGKRDNWRDRSSVMREALHRGLVLMAAESDMLEDNSELVSDEIFDHEALIVEMKPITTIQNVA